MYGGWAVLLGMMIAVMIILLGLSIGFSIWTFGIMAAVIAALPILAVLRFVFR
jgi:hypothetical protein